MQEIPKNSQYLEWTGPIFVRHVSYLLLACWAKFELRRPKLFRLVVDDRLLGELESDLQKVKMRLEAPVSPIHKTDSFRIPEE